jgi:hypothetical protein
VAIIDFPLIHARPPADLPATPGVSVSSRPHAPLTGPDYWTITDRFPGIVTTITHRATGYLLTVPTVGEAYALTRQPDRALAQLVGHSDDAWHTLHTYLHDLPNGEPFGVDELTQAAVDRAVLVLDSMPTRHGIAVYRCMCGGYLTEYGVSATSRPSVRTAPAGYRHLDCCPDCYQDEAEGRANCRLYLEQHPGDWTYQTRCQIVEPAPCSGYGCTDGLRVDQEPCGGDECCGSDDHCKDAR